MYIFAIIILALSLACTFIDSVENPHSIVKATFSMLAIFAFIYIVNL